MKIFIAADYHFGHSNIIKYCNRPYKDTDEMDEALIDNHNSVVSNNDKIFILGDFAFKNKCLTEQIAPRLNGYKVLLLGNHDNHSVKYYLESGFDEVYKYPFIYSEFYVMSHKPIFMNDNVPFTNIYGHVHDNTEFKDYTAQSFCVSMERINYTPIEFDKIVSKMKSCTKEN